MFFAALDVYSLIIPLFIMGLGSFITVLKYFIRLPSYFVMHALAMLTAGCTLLLHSLIHPSMLVYVAPITSTLLFISCSLFCNAVHTRLGLKIRWPWIIAIIISAELLILYFTYIQPSYALRLSIFSIVPFLIFSDNIVAIYRVALIHRVDQLLRLSLIILSGLTFIGIAHLMFTFGSSHATVSRDVLLATIQLAILCLSIALTILLLCCAFQDIYHQLNTDRHQDPLTGLLNRRAMQQRLESMKLQPITMNAVLLCDIDHFKHINDVYGHHFGDLALQHVSKLMQKQIRCEPDRQYPDQISRIGGEEFMIILQDINNHDAIKIAHRIRSSIENSPLYYDQQTIPITISIGVSFFYFYSEIEYAMQQADAKLYEAKHQGRNAVAFEKLDLSQA